MNALFNSNDYKRGKDEGYADGLSGKDMNFIGMGKSMKFVIHGSPALDSYTSGYKAGYSLGSAKRLLDQTDQANATQATSSTTTAASTSKIQSIMPLRGIDGQIELLDSMKHFLIQLIEQINETSATNEQFIKQLDSEQLDLKILGTLEDFLSQTRAKMKDLIAVINDDEIPYVDAMIKYLEESPR